VGVLSETLAWSEGFAGGSCCGWGSLFFVQPLCFQDLVANLFLQKKPPNYII